MLSHLDTHRFDGGYIGVDVFFVLSGYLITRLLVAEHDDSGQIAMRSFYVRRVRRLLPALVVTCVLVGLTFGSLVGIDRRADTLLGIPASLTYMAAWFEAYDVNLFGSLGQVWSLSIEEHFYFIWPVLLAVFLRRGRLLAGTATVTLVSLVWWARFRGASSTFLYFRPDLRAKDLFVGCLLAAMLNSRPRLMQGRAWSLLAVSGASFIALWAASSGHLEAYVRGVNLVILGASAVLIGVVHTQPASLLARALSSPVLTWIGRRSYGIYLLHPPAMTVAQHLLGGWASAAVGIPLSVATAAASYRYVEDPIRRPSRDGRAPGPAV